MSKAITLRIAATLVILAITGVIVTLFTASHTLLDASLAGKQFEDSTASYLGYQASNNLTLAVAIPGLIAIVLIILIWKRPLAHYFSTFGTLALIVSLSGLPYHKAWAFAETTDKTEVVPILPNESAFWIPDVGPNRETQVQFDSESYLQANKVAAKRFEIRHEKLAGTGGKSWTSGWDLYVPVGRLIIVPRQPFSHEWVDAADRGTSARKEGFPCQDNGGLDFGVGVSISTSVSEEQAAKFLYNFGVASPQLTQGQNRNDPQVIFQSVYYGRSLGDVMQDVGRKRIQTLICDQIMSHDIDYDNQHLVEIMKTVRQQASDYFASVGITLNFIGYADTATFAPEVQAAINRKYVAAQDKAAAALLADYTSTIQALAQAEAMRSFGMKTDGRLPTTVVGAPPAFFEMMNSFRLPASSTGAAQAK